MAKASPQQKKIYDTMVLQALRLLYDPKQAASLKKLAGKGNPAEAIASITAMVMKQITTAAGSAGHQIDQRYVVPAGKEVIGHLVEMMVAFKIIPQQSAAAATQEAVAMYADIVSGGGQQSQQQPQPQPQQPQGGLLAQGV